MTILEILEAHKIAAFAGSDTACACDRTWRPNADYRAHLAEVIEAWAQEQRAEAKAEALNQAADEITRLNHDVEMYDENLDATPVNVWLQRRAAQYRKGTP